MAKRATKTTAVSAELPAVGHEIRVSAAQMVFLPPETLIPYAGNARIHSAEQVKRLRASLREYGFVLPILIDIGNNVIAGHGRLMAALEERMPQVPCVLVSDLTEAQVRAYRIADNKLAEESAWDMALVSLELEGLGALEFDTAALGFGPMEPAAPEETDEAVPMGGMRAPKTCICPECGCEFAPGKEG